MRKADPSGRSLSPPWDGTHEGFDAIRAWWGEPGRVYLCWAGMNGWELTFLPRLGGPITQLAWGDRLLRVGSTLSACGPDGED